LHWFEVRVAAFNQKVKWFNVKPESVLTGQRATELDTCFGSLAHPIRRAMIRQLSQGDATVMELAKPHRVSLPAISKHLRVLDEAGLIRIQAEGSFRRVHLRAKALHGAFDWLAHYHSFWEEQLDRLGQHLEAESKGE
jgi:DNA-binding transcriptional ArsR family regulator